MGGRAIGEYAAALAALAAAAGPMGGHRRAAGP